MNNKELVAAGHEFARHMSSDTPIIDIAKMVTRLASQLDVTTAALRQANAQLESQSIELKAAVAAEIDWEKSMMQAVGADGIADVVSAIEKLKTGGAALVAENAALKSAFNPKEIPEDAVEAFTETAIMDHDWDDTGSWSWVENDTDVIRAVLAVMASPETPTTDAFIAEQQAIGVENFSSDVGLEYQQLEPELKPGSAQAKALKNIVFRAVSFAKKLRDEVKS
ncbi:hypothetical protein [Superficieibacter sp. 1612_C1]|uniref:hypothetical protein n=1 Tax=Superficieibacter sp. 1612_C1 TaxID=2780382 RepID=UPI00188430B0|nr:hypothetical protein [Superficieibacter sp. 1612_C1]